MAEDYAINGIPSGIEGLNPVELVRNMLHTAMEKGNDVKEEIQNILALTLAACGGNRLRASIEQ